MIYHLLVTIGILAFLMAGWMSLQAWVRHHTAALPNDCDLLEGRVGCAGCVISGRCKHDVAADQSPTP